MPFKSEKQRRYLWANEPEIASRWAREGKKKKKKSSLLEAYEQGGRRLARR